uniref:Uncharacterized protein n=1 Tax=viral metagenome TaxID=1070528 RepID=A0A6M3XY94_9ZZZZ
MADTQAKLGPGISTIGNGDQQTVLVINTVAAPEKPSILCLHATADSTGVKTPYYLWVDSTGDLRIHTAIPTNQDSDGTVVGAMS